MAPVSLIWARPSAATISEALRPESNIVAKTFLPMEPLIWPDSTSFSNSASAVGVTGLSSISLPEWFRRLRFGLHPVGRIFATRARLYHCLKVIGARFVVVRTSAS